MPEKTTHEMQDGYKIPNLTIKAVNKDGSITNSQPIKGEGSKIHFSRIGLIKNNETYIKQLYPQRESQDDTTLDKHAISPGLPRIEGYQYCKRPIRDGYLYICDQYSGKTECAIHEYQVIDGRLHKILWDKQNTGKNTRETSSKLDFCDYHSFQPAVEYLWVAFSEIQWAWKYVCNLWQDAELRKKRFTRFSPQGWLSQVEQDVSSNNRSFFPLNSQPAYDAGWFWLPEQEKTKAVQAIRSYFEPEHTIVEEKFTELTYQDVSVFFSVDDPLGCIEDISVDITDQNTRIEAYQLSMQTEYSFDSIFSLLRMNKLEQAGLVPAGDEAPEANSLPTATPLLREQYQHLYTSALILYQMLFEGEGKSKDSMETYRKAVSRDKIKKLLAVDERRKCRMDILRMQTAFGEMLFSPYLQYVLADYLKNTDSNRLTGQIRYGLMLSAVNSVPRNKDRYLDIGNKPDSVLEMEWLEKSAEALFYDDGMIPPNEAQTLDILSCEPLHIGRALLGSKINFRDDASAPAGKDTSGQSYNPNMEILDDTPSVVEIADRLNVAFYTIVSLSGSLIYSYRANHYKKIAGLEDKWKCLKQLTAKLNQYNENQSAFTLRKTKADNWLSEISQAPRGKSRAKNLRKLNREFGKLDEIGKQQNIALDEITELERKSAKGHLSQLESPYIEFRRESMKYKTLGKNPYYGNVLIALSILNLNEAVNSVYESNTTKNKLNITAAGLELSSLVVPFFPKLDKAFPKLSMRLGWISTGVGSAVSIIDGIERMDAGDNDAAAAYFVAGTLGLTSAVSGILLSYGVAVGATGPVAVVALLLSTIAVFVGIHNTDDDFETFLRYSVLGDREHIDGNENAIKTMLPNEVKEKLYEQRESLTEIYTRTMNNPNSKGKGKSWIGGLIDKIFGDKKQVRDEDIQIGIDLTDFNNMLRWIYDLMAGFSAIVKFRGSDYCSKIMKKKGRQHPTLLHFDLRYGNYGSGTKPDYQLGIYNIMGNGTLYQQANIPMSSPSVHEVDMTNSVIGNTMYGTTLLQDVRIGDALEQMAINGALGEHTRYIFFFRIIIDQDQGLFWPYSNNGETLYVALCERLVSETNKTNGRCLSAYERTDSVRTSIENPKILMGTKEQILQAATKIKY